jgi:hypothetical protein
MPLEIETNTWSFIALDLADFTKRVYGSTYQETLSIQVHGNCRVRRIYFASKQYNDDELPPEMKLFSPTNLTTPSV